jgi:cytochrome c
MFNAPKVLAPVLLASLLLPATGRAAPNAQSIASERGCMSCHGMVRKQVGPGFAQIADRYRVDSSESSRLAAKIRNGSVGTWGRVIMPQQPQVSDEEAKSLAAWILAQPSPP